MKLLAFDVGGTEIKHAVVEDALLIADKGHVPSPKDSFDSFAETIYRIYLPYREEVEGISMALPGLIDVENGRCNGGGALRYNNGLNVAGLLEEKCGCRVVLENDGKAAVQAEYRYGALKGCRNAAVFLIGTGVGGGLVINGEIVRGRHFSAGEFSFVNTIADDYENDNNILGNSCSTTYLLQAYRKRSQCPDIIDGREFFARLPEDPIAGKVLDELCTNIAVQIYNLYWLLDLEKIAIGGGISRQPVVTEKIREKFWEMNAKSYTGKRHFKTEIDIVSCQFSNDANLIGSCITYSEKYK